MAGINTHARTQHLERFGTHFSYVATFTPRRLRYLPQGVTNAAVARPMDMGESPANWPRLLQHQVLWEDELRA